jgi:hypothetical protein
LILNTPEESLDDVTASGDIPLNTLCDTSRSQGLFPTLYLKDSS